MSISLTPRERSHLKARAHALEPSVHIGHAGLTDRVLAEIDRALTAHQLIKIKIDSDRHERKSIAEAICVKTDAATVQQVGKVTVLWRPTEEKGEDADA
jgi:putative YhbY family RNA-binding protein